MRPTQEKIEQPLAPLHAPFGRVRVKRGVGLINFDAFGAAFVTLCYMYSALNPPTYAGMASSWACPEKNSSSAFCELRICDVQQRIGRYGLGLVVCHGSTSLLSFVGWPAERQCRGSAEMLRRLCGCRCLLPSCTHSTHFEGEAFIFRLPESNLLTLLS